MIENRRKFLNRVKGLESESLRLVEFAYDVTKSAHRHQNRDGGVTRYFEHPRSVALILMDEAKVFDPDMIAAALLHDVAEDTSVFGTNRGVGYSHWRVVAEWRITRAFNSRIARMVLDVSKAFPDGVELSTDAQAKEQYEANLRQAGSDSIIIKMVDRLHNLRTMDTITPEKRIRKVKETEDIYLDIFERGRGFEDGTVFEKLDAKIKQELSRLKLVT